MSIELGRIIKKQWAQVVKSLNKYPDYETVKIPLTQLDIDSKSIYLFLKDFSSMLNENPNLFTLIHDGKKVLRAYAEGSKDGVYNSIIKIELDGWEKATPLHNPEATFHYVKLIAKEKTGVDVGLLKMGHIDFFKEFHPVYNEEKSNLESICHMYDCTRKCVDNELIAFYPEPKFSKFLTETKGIELDPEILENYMERWAPNKNYGVLIKASEGLIGVVASKHDDNLYIEFPREEVDQMEKNDLKSLTKEYRKKLGLTLAIGIETGSLKDIVNKITDHSLKDKEVVDEIIGFMKKNYGENIYVSINPVLDFLLNKEIKYMPAWPLKKIGYKIQEGIFE